MLESKKIELRRSEIRQELATLAAKDAPSEDEVRKIGELDGEYRTLEARYRAALISEDEERKEAGAELETRSGREWAEMMAGFELRQVALALDEGRPLDGQTAEIVSELRSAGGYRGVPVPWAALETRTGETVASGTPDPVQTRPVIDRLFPASVASRMGAQMVNIDAGQVEWPVTTSGATVGWAASETGAVGTATAYATADRALAPDHTLGVQMKLTRKALKQSGAALEAAVRRDMAGAMGAELDRVVFLGSGSSGEPTGILPGASAWSIEETAIDAAPTYSAFRKALVRFMANNAISAPSQVRVLIRPEVWDDLEAQAASTAAPLFEWDRVIAAMGAGNVSMTTNALAAPAGDPLVSKVVLTTTAGGTPPIFVGTWSAVDLIRDPFSDAASGGLRLTALATMDVTISRAEQIEVLTGVQRFTG